MVLPPVTNESWRRFQVDLQKNHRSVKDLEPLAASVRRNGFLQPVGAVEDPETGLLSPIWGFRRILVGIRLEAEDIPTRVFTGPVSPGELSRLSLIENIQRQDLRPSEEARAYRSYLDAEGITASELAEALSVSESKISKKLGLLEVAEPLLALIDEKRIPETCGRDLARLGEATQLLLAEKYRDRDHVSRDEVNEELRAHKVKKKRKPRPRRVSLRLGGLDIAVSGGDASLEALEAALDELKRRVLEARSEGQDFAAFARALGGGGRNRQPNPAV